MVSSKNDEVHSLDYGVTLWRLSSQAASNLYEDGSKLWTKKDLRDIEEQLEHSRTCENFNVRSIDGRVVSIRNPMFGERSPIWQPRVIYQDYWRLVKTQPDRPPGAYHCSYLVDWVNTSARRFRGVMEGSSSAFEDNRSAWVTSTTCELFSLELKKRLAIEKVTKIVCFGLGDMCRKPPEWVRRHERLGEHELEARFVSASMLQHSIALTMAKICQDTTGTAVQLLAQDPDYTDQAKEILEQNGFSIVGQFGAGGFAEVDDDSVVFSVFVEAPLKQIVADLGRPLLIISDGFEVFNDSEKPWADAESPRTQEMWKEYDKFHFPISTEDGELLSKLRGLYLYVRKAADSL